MDIPAVPDAGNGTPPIVDMGAYEAVPVLYAVPDGLESGGCSSWANACTLRYALSKAIGGQEIWVKAGVHYPGAAGNREATFTLKNGVALYGGFAGTETSRDQRDWQANVTVLSGDIDGNDITDPYGVVTTTANITGTNVYHVVTGGGTNNTAILDGFVITAGQANGGSWPHSYGGGMINDFSHPTLSNVTFSGNFADYGGGMHNRYSNPTLTHVTFSNNNATQYGGGMYNDHSSPTVMFATFLSNHCEGYGGGMHNHWWSSPTLINVTFIGNSSNAWGGGLHDDRYQSNATLRNVIFIGNSASYGGGGMQNYGSTPSMTNVIFVNNRAVWGGGMQNRGPGHK